MGDSGSLGNLIGETAHGYLKSFLKEKKKNLDGYFLVNKLGFVPKGMDYSDYKKIQKKNSFKQLKFLIGKKHPSLGIILLGMYLASFSYEERRDCVDKHRQEVYDKHGSLGVAILNMGLTGFIDVYIKWLSDYNVEKNPSTKELVDIYEAILKEWRDITIFVQTAKGDNTIRNKLVSKMASQIPFIYVFASASAIKKWKSILEKCKRDNILTEYDYKYNKYILNGSKYEIVWIFENTLRE